MNLTLPSTLTSIASPDLAALISDGSDLAGGAPATAVLCISDPVAVSNDFHWLSSDKMSMREELSVKRTAFGASTGRGSSAITRPMVNNWPSISTIRASAEKRIAFAPPLNRTQFGELEVGTIDRRDIHQHCAPPAPFTDSAPGWWR